MSYEVQDFEIDVVKRSHEVPVLVDFWAPWCGPCKVLGPLIERLASEAKGRWVLVKVNTEEHAGLAQRFEIRSIPNVKLFHQGRAVDEFVGALQEPEIRRWLARALPSPHAGTVGRARQLLDGGDAAGAAQLLEPVVESDPGDDEARTLLARSLLTTAPERVELVLHPIGPESEMAGRAAALRTLARFARLPEAAGALPEHAARARYLDGARRIRAGDWAAALEAFIEVLQRDRHYDHEGAKEACKAIFQVLGIRHPIAERYHRAFSSALHS